MKFSYIAKIIIIFFLRLYRLLFSSWSMPHCRYYPTCSEYAITAVCFYGPFKGLLMAVKRMLRCHPWGGYGYDPVPETSDFKSSDVNIKRRR